VSEQPLNLKRSLHILTRHCIRLGFIVLLGTLAGAGFAVLNPPLYSDTAFVVLSNSTPNMSTQALIAASNPVLAGAGRSLHPAMSTQALRRRLQVADPMPFVLSIAAEGETAAQAMNTANAVADSYVAYVSAPNNPSGKVSARVLQRATFAAKTRLLIPMLTIGGIGALAGLLVGAVGLLAVYRNNRRLRQRDEIADAIGVPVLASVTALHPKKADHWTRLLGEYAPGAADAQRLRNVLHRLGHLDLVAAHSASRGTSVTVLSLYSDWRALALGPQLATFAAGQGTRTALVIGGQEDLDSVAELRAACSAWTSSSRPGLLRVAAADHGSLDWPDAALTVVVAVAGTRYPAVADSIQTDALLLGVSAGAVTAEELARVAASAASDRAIAGILMADPDPTDPTTGRLRQLGPGTGLATPATRAGAGNRR
jgi:capsular polysaccharide biosynthesis protein